MNAVGKLVSFKEHIEVEDRDDSYSSSPQKPSIASHCPIRSAFDLGNLPIYQAVLPGGKRIPILKTLLTSACENNCNYCSCRAGRDFQRETFRPEEMAKTFINLAQSGIVQGLFLSSGVAGGGVTTQDRLLATAEILRTRMNYGGYVHLKLMPGAQKDQVFRAMQLADRVSINLEAPSSGYLRELAPQKILLEDLLKPLQWVEEIRHTCDPALGWQGSWPSSTTQFVVGAVKETDLDLLKASAYLHRQLRLKRIYFSSFRPVHDTPLQDGLPSGSLRELRLYQSAFLLRDYGFDVEELPFESGGNLPQSVDPKLAWAQVNLQDNPVEINTARRSALLHIPGIGPKSAAVILAHRQRNPIKSITELSGFGIYAHRAAPFILINGRRPPQQLELFVR